MKPFIALLLTLMFCFCSCKSTAEPDLNVPEPDQKSPSELNISTGQASLKDPVQQTTRPAQAETAVETIPPEITDMEPVIPEPEIIELSPVPEPLPESIISDELPADNFIPQENPSVYLPEFQMLQPEERLTELPVPIPPVIKETPVTSLPPGPVPELTIPPGQIPPEPAKPVFAEPAVPPQRTEPLPPQTEPPAPPTPQQPQRTEQVPPTPAPRRQ